MWLLVWPELLNQMVAVGFSLVSKFALLRTKEALVSTELIKPYASSFRLQKVGTVWPGINELSGLRSRTSALSLIAIRPGICL
jgi:hypothetical protein